MYFELFCGFKGILNKAYFILRKNSSYFLNSLNRNTQQYFHFDGALLNKNIVSANFKAIYYIVNINVLVH